VGLYLNPPERELVLCNDERSQVQALDRYTSDTAVTVWKFPRTKLSITHAEGTPSLFAARHVRLVPVTTGHLWHLQGARD
jgi:hypothetical protein